MKILNKVKCNICGKVGLRNMPKPLARHLRLAHKIFTKEIDSYLSEIVSIKENKIFIREKLLSMMPR